MRTLWLADYVGPFPPAPRTFNVVEDGHPKVVGSGVLALVETTEIDTTVPVMASNAPVAGPNPVRPAPDQRSRSQPPPKVSTVGGGELHPTKWLGRGCLHVEPGRAGSSVRAGRVR